MNCWVVKYNGENKLQFKDAETNRAVLSVSYLGHLVKKWFSSTILPMVQFCTYSGLKGY